MVTMMSYLMLNFITMIFNLIIILIGVAFFTLLERKFLGYVQLRKGPNKMGYKGILQPFSDAIKLLSNEMFSIKNSSYFFFFLSPMMMFLMSLSLWILMPFYFNMYSFNYGILFLFCLLSLNSYFVMLVGWSSNSNYAMLGCLRSIAQSISYEVSFMMMTMVLIIIVESFSLYNLIFFQSFTKLHFIYIFFPVFIMFYLSMLAELNRTPFDLVEGESELVSGFNIEYASSMFTMIFLAEYSNIMFMSMILVIMFFGFEMYSIEYLIMVMMISLSVIWLRSVMPRIRYDQLMSMCWKKFLPISLMYVIMIFIYKFMFKLMS